MRRRKLRRIIDARAKQGRVIAVLECGHNISVDALLHATKDDLLALVDVGEFDCPECPDPPPAPPREESPMEAFYRASFEKEE